MIIVHWSFYCLTSMLLAYNRYLELNGIEKAMFVSDLHGIIQSITININLSTGLLVRKSISLCGFCLSIRISLPLCIAFVPFSSFIYHSGQGLWKADVIQVYKVHKIIRFLKFILSKFPVCQNATTLFTSKNHSYIK